MPKYGVEISEGMVGEIDVAPGAPALRRVVLEWDVPKSEVLETLQRFGMRDGTFTRTAGGAWTRVVPLTRDGERVGKVLLRVWEVTEPVPSAGEGS